MIEETSLSLLQQPLWALVAELLGFALLIAYQLYISRLFRISPERTYRGRSNQLRQQWVTRMRALGSNLLAVQTLRNWVISAALLAATGLVLSLGTFSLALQGGDWVRLSATLSLAPAPMTPIGLKLLILAALFFSAFVYCALALRFYNQTGLLIHLGQEDDQTDLPLHPGQAGQGDVEDSLVAATLNRAGGYFHLGLRSFLLAVPFGLWLVGPEWFLAGTLLTLIPLRRFDLWETQWAAPAAGQELVHTVGDPHALEGEEVLHALRTTPEGLSGTEAASRLAAVGPNRLPPPQKDGPLKRFFRHFHDILIYILLAAAVATAIKGYWIDTWVILAVAVINAVIGFIQEGRAEDALEGIRKMLSLHARGRRDGTWQEVDAGDLVPGDIVALKAGDRVPADLRLIAATQLRVEESALTGESVPVNKGTDPVPDAAGIGDRLGMVYSGTLVAAGIGTGVVTATGARTELGRITRLITEIETLETPLTRQMTAFGRVLAVIILIMAVGMLGIGWFVHNFAPTELMMAAIGFAVAAIPEGLPAIMTITLALGVQQMVRRNAITRKLPAVETLGSVTVICSDKTGTLTRNEMTARQVITPLASYEVAGIGYAPEGHLSLAGRHVQRTDHPDLDALVEVMAVCNDAEIAEEAGHWKVIGEPTEGALRTLAHKAAFEPAGYQRLAEVPFDSEHKFMATLNRLPDGRVRILMKGAPDRLLDRCGTQFGPGGEPQPLDRSFWEAQIDDLSAQGLRVLAAAQRDTAADQDSLVLEDLERDLVLVGLVGIIDPPRPEAIQAIATCRQAGIRVKMITGDHAGTALAIGREMGIIDPDDTSAQAVTGTELEAASDEDLQVLVARHDIFARTSPEHKLRLVQALQANGEVVAMTGDGVNDAPALKRADVGVAMGIKGTEATKEAAEIVLADDNFASIERAVEEGRTIYDNLQKSILFMLPTNGAQALVILVAILFGLTLPLSPVQILWVNMVTAVTLSLALAFEPPEPGVMQRPPRRPGAGILGGYQLWRITFVSLLIGMATLGVFQLVEAEGIPLPVAQTMAVNTLAFGQLFFLFNSRFLRDSSLRPRYWFTNWTIWLAAGLLVVLQVFFVYSPLLNLWFHSAPLLPLDWLLPVVLGLGVFFLVEIEKAVARLLSKPRRTPTPVG